MFDQLLIEPVWNRNLTEKLAWLFVSSLLIEPVWNRNTGVHLIQPSRPAAFNRTSLESKQ